MAHQDPNPVLRMVLSCLNIYSFEYNQSQLTVAKGIWEEIQQGKYLGEVKVKVTPRNYTPNMNDITKQAFKDTRESLVNGLKR